MSAERPIRHAWHKSDRFVPRRFVRPTLQLLRWEAAGGVVMLVAAAAALIWANSPWSDSYERLWTTPIGLRIGDLPLHHLEALDLRLVINDGLMAFFFFVVAMEIKRELVAGDLRDRRAAALPVIAAAGGMLAPALIYLVIAAGGGATDGWAIPTATDIAFAVGVLSLVPAVPTGARLFLLTLAIADDLGAIVIIAIAYTDGVKLGWLIAAIGCLAVAFGCARIDLRSLFPYVTVGILAWVFLLESGVHATLAGVAMGFLTPTWSFHDPRWFAERARPLVDEIERSFADGVLTQEENERDDAALDALIELANESRSPLDRLVRRLGPLTAFVIVPIFALANAGVTLPGIGTFDEPVVVGVAAGLVLGKTIGVYAATILAVSLGIGVLPPGVKRADLLGVAMCAGVGFTVALFVAGLSFPAGSALGDQARLGILLGSLIAGLLGYSFLRLRSRRLIPTTGECEALAASSADLVVPVVVA